MNNEEEPCGCSQGVPMSSPQQLMEMMAGEQKKWTDMLKRMIEDIEKLDPKDRLESVCAIHQCLIAINISLKGWSQWFNRIQPLNDINEEDYKHIFDTVKEVALILLKMDELITSEAEKRQEAEIKQEAEKIKAKQPKKGTKDETRYVA